MSGSQKVDPRVRNEGGAPQRLPGSLLYTSLSSPLSQVPSSLLSFLTLLRAVCTVTSPVTSRLIAMAQEPPQSLKEKIPDREQPTGRLPRGESETRGDRMGARHELEGGGHGRGQDKEQRR